jgi:hypothetical protein
LIRYWLPFALLGAAIALALTVLQPSPLPGPSAERGAEPSASTEAPPSPGGPARPGDPPLTDLELRDSHLHLAHELCEEGARRINRLAGKDENDAQGAMRTMSVCLRHGNVAWYKCILRAGSYDQAAACNRRLLTGENVP